MIKMKNLVVILFLALGVSVAYAQEEKTARDYKVEGADAYKAKDYQKGLESFEKAIQLYEAEGKIDTSLYFNAAICAIKIDDYEKTVTYFDRSIELDYKPCKSRLYQATALHKMEAGDKIEEACLTGIEKCSSYKSKFNEILFSHYLKQGLEIFNNAAKMQADVTPLANTDPEKYKQEMEKVKSEFERSLPLLEKAHDIDPADANATKALKQAYEILDMQAKAASL